MLKGPKCNTSKCGLSKWSNHTKFRYRNYQWESEASRLLVQNRHLLPEICGQSRHKVHLEWL